jgi:hypothetical protein
MSGIPGDVGKWIDDLAARFAQAWKRGKRPRIEDDLVEVPGWYVPRVTRS